MGSVTTDTDFSTVAADDEMGVSDLTEEGARELHPDFADRNGYAVRTLVRGKAAQLKKWGISTLRNYVGATNTMESIAVDDASLKVASVGVALAATRADAETAIHRAHGYPCWYGRIMLGIGDTSSLMTEGYVQAPALCPGGIQNADVVSYSNYVLILPRMEATVTALALIAVDASGDAEEYTLTSDFDGDGDGTADTTYIRLETMTPEAQDKWSVDMSCPEGHKWPGNDNDYWIAS